MSGADSKKINKKFTRKKNRTKDRIEENRNSSLFYLLVHGGDSYLKTPEFKSVSI